MAERKEGELMLRAAAVIALAAKFSARTAGMVATNTERERNGYALAYGEQAFEEVISALEKAVAEAMS